MEIGKKIKAKRNVLGLTLEELSQKSGVPKSKISKVENGRQVMDLDAFVKLAEALNISINFNFEK